MASLDSPFAQGSGDPHERIIINPDMYLWETSEMRRWKEAVEIAGQLNRAAVESFNPLLRGAEAPMTLAPDLDGPEPLTDGQYERVVQWHKDMVGELGVELSTVEAAAQGLADGFVQADGVLTQLYRVRGNTWGKVLFMQVNWLVDEDSGRYVLDDSQLVSYARARELQAQAKQAKFIKHYAELFGVDEAVVARMSANDLRAYSRTHQEIQTRPDVLDAKRLNRLRRKLIRSMLPPEETWWRPARRNTLEEDIAAYTAAVSGVVNNPDVDAAMAQAFEAEEEQVRQAAIDRRVKEQRRNKAAGIAARNGGVVTDADTVLGDKQVPIAQRLAERPEAPAGLGEQLAAELAALRSRR